jgi:hypothetical protein
MVMKARSRERIRVDIAITVISVLDSVSATIVDLSEDGALLTVDRMPRGNRIMIDIDGQSVFATVIWTEPDRMGVRFPFSLTEGPLYAALQTVRAMRNMPAPALTPRGAFGRRSIN